MQTFRYRSRLGQLFYSAPTPQPSFLMIPGFMRHMGDLKRWELIFPGLGFLHLPGQDGAPLMEVTSIESWTAAFTEMLGHFRERPRLIGESLGAVLALSLPSRAVVAVEPLLSTSDLWPLRAAIADAKHDGFEVKPQLEELFSRSFDGVLGRISSPTLVLAGSEPLMPERDVRRPPSLLSDEDFNRFANHPLVQARRIAGGHALLDTSAAEVAQSALQFLAGLD